MCISTKLYQLQYSPVNNHTAAERKGDDHTQDSGIQYLFVAQPTTVKQNKNGSVTAFKNKHYHPKNI